MGRVAAFVLFIVATGGCAGAPDAPRRLPRPGPLDERLREVADAMAVGLGGSVTPAEPRIALRLSAADGFERPLRDALVGRVAPALLERVEALAEQEAADRDGAFLIERGPRGPRRIPLRERWEATHLIHARAEAVEGGWRVRWELVELATGRRLSSAEHRVFEGELSPPPPPPPPPPSPTEVTRAILDAIRRGDGRAVTAHLHPELARRWSGKARSRAMDLPGYVLHYFGEPPLASLGPVTQWEEDRGATRAEVEVQFAHKVRDVDFQYRLSDGRWRLFGVDDYRR